MEQNGTMNTKQIILDNAYQLLCTHRFDQITVQDVLDAAHVSRSTFYRYFVDKYDLIHEYYKSYVDKEIMSHFDGHNARELYRIWFSFIREQKVYFSSIKAETGQNSFWEFAYDYSKEICKYVKLRNTGRDELTEKEKYEIEYIASGNIAVFKKALVQDSMLQPEMIADLVYELVPEEYKSIIRA